MTDSEIRRVGKHLTEAMLGVLGKWAVIWAIVYVVIMAANLPARDATDPPSGSRSQLMLRIDHGTGCQYLETAEGSLSPRLGRDGKQVCEQ